MDEERHVNQKPDIPPPQVNILILPKGYVSVTPNRITAEFAFFSKFFHELGNPQKQLYVEWLGVLSKSARCRCHWHDTRAVGIWDCSGSTLVSRKEL